MSLPDIASLEETAEYLRIKPELLRRLARRHEIAFMKQGLALTFRKEAVEAYALSKETPATAPKPFGHSARSASRLARKTG